MSEFPKLITIPDPLFNISILSPQSTGIYVSSTTPTSITYPSSNLALYIPFRITRTITVTQMYVLNGATASGNIDVGIYDSEGTKLTSVGSTAQSGTSTIQIFNVPDVQIGPGLFYMAVAMDNTTGTLQRLAPSTPNLRIYGLAQEASAFPLPTTATFATLTNQYLPYMGLTTRSFV